MKVVADYRWRVIWGIDLLVLVVEVDSIAKDGRRGYNP